MQGAAGRAALASALACFAAYVVGLAPSPYWLDSSELAAGAFELGVAHPPGHPLALLVGKLCALLPVGSIALRVGLASALAAAAAAGVTALVGAELARRVLAAGKRGTDGDDRLCALVGGAGGVGFGLSYAAAFQAVRPEVYALNTLLVLAALWGCLRWEATGERGPLHAAALALGLGLANHHFLTALVGGAVLLFLVAGRRPSLRSWLVLVAAGAAGVLLYLYLPLRAGRHPEVDWGAPSTVARLYWTVSARAFQKSLAHAAVGGGLDVAFAWAGELGLAAPLALLGGYLLFRLPATRRAGLLVVGALVLDAAGPALVGFDPQNPDAYGYLAPSVALGAALAAAAIAMIASAAPRPAARGALAAALAIAAAIFPALSLPASLRPRFADADRVWRALLDEAPPRAALVTSNFQTVFGLWYLRGVEGRRPDVDHLHRHFLAYPGYRDEVRSRCPALAPILGDRDVERLPELAARRPVLVEYDLDLSDEIVASLVAGAWIDRLAPEPPAAPARDAAARATTARLAAVDPLLDEEEPQTRRALFWRDVLAASRACRQHRRGEADVALARARGRLGGGRDPDLEALAGSCPN